MHDITEKKIVALEEMANTLRQDVIKMVSGAGSGHIGGPLGMADIFAAMYFHILSHDPKNPHWEHRDRLVLSNGHICPVLYAALAHSGYFPVEELKTFRKLGTRLQGHPHPQDLGRGAGRGARTGHEFARGIPGRVRGYSRGARGAPG